MSLSLHYQTFIPEQNFRSTHTGNHRPRALRPSRRPSGILRFSSLERNHDRLSWMFLHLRVKHHKHQCATPITASRLLPFCSRRVRTLTEVGSYTGSHCPLCPPSSQGAAVRFFWVTSRSCGSAAEHPYRTKNVYLSEKNLLQ